MDEMIAQCSEMMNRHAAEAGQAGAAWLPNEKAPPANPAERLAALRLQRQALEAEIAEVSRIAELEYQRHALLAAGAARTGVTNAAGGLDRS